MVKVNIHQHQKGKPNLSKKNFGPEATLIQCFERFMKKNGGDLKSKIFGKRLFIRPKPRENILPAFGRTFLLVSRTDSFANSSKLFFSSSGNYPTAS